jgi:Flp pilus assembly pilin Flp
MKRKKINSQSLIEYTTLLALVAAAVVAMRVFLTRSVQERYRQSADVFGQGEQYVRGKVIDQSGESPLTKLPPLVEETKDLGCEYVSGYVQSLSREYFGYDEPDPEHPGRLLHYPGLREQERDFYRSALMIEETLLELGGDASAQARLTRGRQAQAKRTQAIDKAKELNDQAGELEREAAAKEEEAARAANDEQRQELLEEAADLRAEASDLRDVALSQSEQLNRQAAGLEGQATAGSSAESESGNRDVDDQVRQLQKAAERFRQQAQQKDRAAQAKAQKIQKLKQDNATCFGNS